MEDNEGGNFSIPDNDEVLVPEHPWRRVRPQPAEVCEELPVILVEDEMPMDPYNLAMRQFNDNLARGVNHLQHDFGFHDEPNE